MDLVTQERILDLSRSGDNDLVVLLGAPDSESAELSVLTVMTGDPTFAGPLAGVQLGLPAFHILESTVEAVADTDAYAEHVELMKFALDTEGIRSTMTRLRTTTE